MAEPGPMPILETGKGTAGFTLLEVAAVIALIGVISILALPRITLSLEQVEVGSVGRLIQSDLRQMRNESVMDPATEKVVSFTENGYSFTIGDHCITRNFRYEFAFELPQQAEDEALPPDALGDARRNETAPSGTLHPGDDADDGDGDSDDDDSSEVPPEPSCEIHFIGGELDNEVQFNWKTRNFEGSFLCKADGAVEWKYQRQQHSAKSK